MSDDNLIQLSASVINTRIVDDRKIGDVGCALITEKGNIYKGVCIDVGSGMGFCAEHSAIAAMVTAGESRINKIVATWKNENGNLYVLPPCGRCREFIKQIHDGNLGTEVIVGPGKSVKLTELLPLNDEFVKV